MISYQVKAILWKNAKQTKLTDLLKEAFIPLLAVFILFGSQINKEFGKIFVELMIPIYIPSSFSGLARQLLVDYVGEKRTKLRDIYHIMGMQQNNYRIAWFITYLMKSLVILGIIGLSFYFLLDSLLTATIINVNFCLFLFAAVSETFLISTFFQDPQLAGEFGSFFLTIASMSYFLVFLLDNSWIAYAIIMCFPQATFSLILMSYLSNSLKLERIWPLSVGLFVSSIIYIILFIYLESNDKSIFSIFRKKKRVILENELELENLSIQEQKQAITIENLVKKYDSQIALDLSLNIAAYQIFCILGQNGAGKTTTLNILTGLTQKTSGRVTILDLDVDYDREKISKSIGYCCQENILYKELTVIQNLMYQGMLRGLNGQMLMMECQNIISDLDIQQFASIQVGKLSGGNRRKVAIGISLIAGSQIIFLDEPTASLDPNSRRQIWEILKKLRLSKTIILTTHFMDEAEYLADTIAILKKGQLITKGTAQKIKDEFNVGYKLFCEPQIAQEYFSNQNPSNIVLENDIFQYYNIFKEIEQNGNKVIVYDYSKIRLVQNTLEDAFLKLNKQNEEQLQHEPIQIRDDDLNYQIEISENPFIRFILQVIALILRKYYQSIRNFSTLIMILLPIAFLLIGMIVGTPYLNNLNGKLEVQMFFVSLFIVQSFSLNSSIFINTPIQEREIKIRQQLKQLGVSHLAYWSGTFVGDYIIVMFSNLIIYLMLRFGTLSFYQDYIINTILILEIFGFSFILYSYICSYLFENSKSAYKLFPVYNFLLSYTFPQLIFDIWFQNPQYSAYSKASALISPLYALDRALRELRNNEHWFYLGIMLVQIAMYIIILIYLESHTLIWNSRDLNGTEIQIQRVTHKYDKTQQFQLNDVSLTFQKGQIISLLGPNGAGKSTLIQLLTDCIKLQKGSIQYLENQKISTCQQEEGVWDDLSPIEICYLFSLLKGATKNVNSDILSILKALSIHTYKQIKNLSGGQKRKVAIAISLLGRDNTVILDEPSNGLDPFSRRNLWKLIKEHIQVNRSTILLTTHDMDEAQNLSDQIAILIKGEIRENESCRGLIDRLGSGVQLVINSQKQLNLPDKDRIGDQYILNITNQPITQTLDLLKSLEYDSFQFIEANLEQVFLRLTQLQYDE